MDAAAAPEDAVWARSEAVLAEALDPELVLFDLDRRDLHRLNASAAAVWRSLDGRSTVTDLAASLAMRLGVPLEQVLRDTLPLLERLADAGLVVRVGTGSVS